MVERQHVGAVGKGGGWRGVRFDKQAVGPHSNGGFGNGFDERGLAPGHAAGLVGLLQRMGHVHHHGHLEAAHGGQVAEVHHQFGIAKGIAALGEQNVGVAGLPHLVNGKLHGLAAQKLAFFDVYHLAGLGSGDEQIGLPAQERRDLQHIHVLRGQRGLARFVDIGDGGHPNFAPHFLQDAQRRFVANTGKGVEPRAVGLAVGTFKDEGNLQLVRHVFDALGNAQGHVFAFDDAGTGHEEKLARIGVAKMRKGVGEGGKHRVGITPAFR